MPGNLDTYRLFILIPVHNRIELTLKCLRALHEQSFSAFNIVVIDDGSTDGTKDTVNSHFPDVIIIEGSGNWWWTHCLNIGIKWAERYNADYILSFNNDTLPSHDFIEKLMKRSGEHPGAILGSAGLDQSGNIIYAGIDINWKTANFRPLAYDTSILKTGLIPVKQYAGRGLLIPMAAIKKIGYFDETNFPHYGADIDFTNRATKSGIPVYCDCDAGIYINPYLSGANQLRMNKNILNYFRHLFGRKGGGNLIGFAKFAIRNCPKLYLPTFMLLGIIRRILGYWKPSNSYRNLNRDTFMK